MKKLFYFLSAFLFFFALSVKVDAARGDLIYNIRSVSISDNGINIKGYAFIHRTHNYVTVYARKSNGSIDFNTVVADKGGQKVKIIASTCSDINDEECFLNPNNVKEIIYDCVNDDSGDDDYNFYKQMYHENDKNIYDYDDYKTSLSASRYNDFSSNRCDPDNSQCYYEDIGFDITFTIKELLSKFSNDDKLYFYIAAYNKHYGKFTGKKPLVISSISGSSSYVDITENEIKGLVNFVASDAHWRQANASKVKTGFYGCTRPKENSKFGEVSWCGKDNYTCGKFGNEDCRYEYSEYYIAKLDDGSLFKSSSDSPAFLKNTTSPGLYSFCVYTSGNKKSQDACVEWDDNEFCTKCASGSSRLYAYTSWIEINGSNQLNIILKNPNLCEVTDPDKDSGVLECNQGKIYNSTCEKLTVTTSEGSAVVRIEQKGNVTSVLTPDSIYAGGGFNLGVMYYNTIKWSYVDGQNINNKLHAAVSNIMNRKIKDYDSFVAGINLSNMKIGEKSFNLVKQCTTSNRNKDYYNKELTVSCVFTIPKSDIDLIGNVSYDYTSGIDINNKYYTPLNYEGKYKITADITGMDRITESSSVSDSADEKKRAWTGNWKDSFTNCEIDVYGLLMKNNAYNFIYRPIDISNPFPNRNAGINWFDWYNITRNKERLENTYLDGSQYKVTLDNNAINDIKNYNGNYDYLEWDSIDKDTYESSFITENDYIVRGGH